MLLWLTCLLGLFYPLLITAVAYLTMPVLSQGSLMVDHGKIIGSELIAQKFSSLTYFWPRPSAVDYNPLPSGGSNLGPTSTLLKKVVEERQEIVAKAHEVKDIQLIPSELVYASGSGLDPHITLSTALFQLDRVATARKLDTKSKQAVHRLVLSMATSHDLHILGRSCINVLKLNRALDELTKAP